jgi:deazaflavin-dependent oxidoreductase (nitroreductase family)
VPAVRVGAPLRVFWRIHRGFMCLTGGRFGRTSGNARDVTLNYMAEGRSFVVIASYGGEDRDPAWWRNLKASPEGEVLIAGTHIRVRAREADGPEREALWDRFVAADPSYERYQGRTKRRLPVVLLEPMTRQIRS